MEPSVHTPPCTILFATDLTVRCDRALSRVQMLAKTWGARLVAVHAFEQSEDLSGRLLDHPIPSACRPPDLLEETRNRIRRDILPSRLDSTIVVERGTPVEVIARATKTLKCDLIVTGIGRDETLTRLGLRRTIDRLVTRLGVPLLTVREKVSKPYQNILVAMDLSEASQRALRIATVLFPSQSLSALHAYELPIPGGTAEAEYREAVTEECATIVAAEAGTASLQRRLRLHVKPGWPSEVIRRHVLEHDVDLVVLGAHDRGALFDMLFGSTAKDILTSLPCDVLIVGRRGAPKRNSSLQELVVDRHETTVRWPNNAGFPI